MAKRSSDKRISGPLWLAVGSFLLLVMAFVAVSRGATSPQANATLYMPVTVSTTTFGLTPAGGGFFYPTEITHAGDERLFVAQINGIVKVLHPDGRIGEFLDISQQVLTMSGEYGFYDIAFHPGYLDPESPGYGFFYVAYTRGHDNDQRSEVDLVISRFRVSADPDLANPASETILLLEDQQTNIHKGGALDFDRRDNMLYASVGDDRKFLIAQQADSRKGKVLRLAVDGVPADVTGDATAHLESEIIASGLRNPWRIDVDEPSNKIFIGDVGHQRWEEINLLSLDETGNFGWPCIEGPYVWPQYKDDPLCQAEFTPPIWQYVHDASLGNCAVIAGRVYRPKHNPADGRFLYGDLCSRELATLAEAGGAWQAALLGKQANGQFSTFGEGADGALYVGSFTTSGPIYRMFIP